MKLGALSRTVRLMSAIAATASGDRLKSLLVRTPAEAPLQAMRTLWTLRQLRRRPELYAILIESLVISRVLERIVKESSCCVDVGCHVGSMLSTFLRLAPRGRHAAVEPVPYKARWLRQRFPEVDVFEVALTQQAGEAELFLDLDRSGFSGLRPHGEGGRQLPLRVRTARLDQLLPGRAVDLVKIDVEGGELGVMMGATELLARCGPRLLFECTASGLQAHGLQPRDVLRWLEEHGYAVWTPADYLTLGPPLDLERFEAALMFPFQAFNFFAEPRS